MLFGTLHPLANFSKVGEDGLLVSFTHALRRWDLVALGARTGEVGMLRMEEREEAAQEEVVCNWSRGIVLPDAGALHHVTLLYLWLGSSGLLFTLGLVTSSSGELSLEVVLDLLFVRLLLFLERSEVTLARIAVLALGLFARLLLLLKACQ